MNRLIAISDIHGCFNPFYDLVVNVVDLKKSDRIVLLGDYIDRGEQSREVIDFIIDLGEKGFDIIPLTGNHEQMLIDSFNSPEMLPLWYMNSGMTTLESFGITDITDIDYRYIEFFKNLGFYLETKNFLFVHAGFNDHAADPFSDRENMIWECRPSYNNPVFFGKTIIHGHRPKHLEYVLNLIREKSKVIPIDTGCVYERELGYGFLSALDVYNMNLISVPNN
jgi:serine/threonine protein phosphatase 1